MAKLPHYERTRLLNLADGLRLQISLLQGSIPDTTSSVEDYLDAVSKLDKHVSRMEEAALLLVESIKEIELGS